jgi:hypothetical protein
MLSRLLTAITAVILAASLGPAVAAEEPEHDHAGMQAQEEDPHAGHQMHEGAITFSDGTQEYKANVLGGNIGKQTVAGVDVGLFVLQAESPERLKPGAAGPTHLFNVTLVLAGEAELLKEASGAVVVTGKGEPQRVALSPFKSHHQAPVRLDEPGEYTLMVEFSAAGKTGKTDPMSFAYRWSPEVTAAVEAAMKGEGGDEDHSEHEHDH